MAPPVPLFPLSELHDKVQYHTVNYKQKRRKVRDFDLETCELFELVQYSCTTMRQQMERASSSPTGQSQMECYPFVRLFRRCGKGDRMFHVETTAWEGEHAYKAPPAPQVEEQTQSTQPEKSTKTNSPFANYGSYFWSTGMK